MEIWSREKVVQELRNIRAQGRFPSLDRTRNSNRLLFDMGIFFFRFWENALMEADIIQPPYDPDMFYDHDMCAWAHDSIGQPYQRYLELRLRP